MLAHIIEGVAKRCPIALDELTLGQHPDAQQREAGELAMLDWGQPGGPVVADGELAVPSFLARVGAIRAIGAAMLAARCHDRAVEDLPLLAGVAAGAEYMAEQTKGGPVDSALRMGLAARACALDALGQEGHETVAYNLGGHPRELPSLRPQSRLSLSALDIHELAVLAFSKPDERDRAAEREASACASMAGQASSMAAQRRRHFWLPQ